MSFEGVSILTFAPLHLHLSGLDGGSGFRVYVGTMEGTQSSGPQCFFFLGGGVEGGGGGTRRVKTLNPISPKIYWKATTSLIGR